MEQRLKKERNRLILRVTLIMLAIWLTLSGVFCAVRLSNEKVNVQKNELADLSHFMQLMTVGNTNDTVNRTLLEYTNPSDGQGQGKDTHNKQLIITDRKTNQVISDTAGGVGVLFYVKIKPEYSYDLVGIMHYDDIRSALSDEEYQRITELLNTERDDGNYYEAICTKFHIEKGFIPLELKIVLVNGKDSRFTVDNDVAVFDLSENKIDGSQIYESGDIRRNTVPKDFIADGVCNKDIIGSLTKEQRKSAVEMIPTGMFRYIFYASDYLNHIGDEYEEGDASWLVQYAKEVDILDSCKTDLAFGVCAIFGFFLTIGAILCVMIWKTVKAQMIQEQKRLDLTNALAHDIKTPLFVISGYAYSLKEDIDENERGLYLDKIIEQTDEVNSLVHRMLNFSKLDSYAMTLNRSEFDLCELARSIAEKYTSLPDNKTLDFTHSGDSVITADRELIKTALQNLIDNAAKYSLPDSEIQIDVSEKTVTVSNESEPMTKSELKQIWQPYFRKDKSRHEKGNGLGLSIVKSILDLHKASYRMFMDGSRLICQIMF
ncbi:MAG: HAMP domain-containing histidine kinase [Ruminococcus sp.]|uniref:sensor histidine kinase n=1 Tax=Ruminococcus sp. TaxID=41978 RepID=UPI002872EB87|nr:HAMP domain-containing sensor histidine kinase [Ruminococcus sp.]MBQ3285940.1 HAMP domain-containing histidine kinase [Ruminococcus sp.]